MKQITFTLTGRAPLMQHNERLANPLDEHAQRLAAVSKKRAKTLDDHETLAKLEFVGGLYIDDSLGPYVPGAWVHAALIEGGKAHKLGTTMRAAALVQEDKLPLQYDGPRDPEGLWKAGFFDQRGVKVQRAKTMRTRPIFREWSISGTVLFDETALNHAGVVAALERAGEFYGMGDYRPRFGRFNVEVSK